MSDYAHAADLLAQSSVKADPHKRWVDMQNGAYPKLCTGYQPTFNLIKLLEYYKFDYAALKQRGIAAEGRCFIYRNSVFPPDEAAETSEWQSAYSRKKIASTELLKMAEELRALGCAVVVPKMHQWDICDAAGAKTGKGYQLWLFLPWYKPNEITAQPATGVPAPAPVIPDFEGGVMFLAYLLHKGLVSEKDIPPGDPIYSRQDFTVPFSQTMLKLAQSVKYQNKVHKGLGEPLLPEPPQKTQNRGTALY